MTPTPTPPRPESELWRQIFELGHPALLPIQKRFRWMPSPPRCQLCFVPFGGIGRFLPKSKGWFPSARNPDYCSRCDGFIQAYPGGAHVTLSMVFTDVRNSTEEAERSAPADYHERQVAYRMEVERALRKARGFLLEEVGDQVVGVFPPGFVGAEHARLAIDCAKTLLQNTALREGERHQLQFGVGVHTSRVYICSKHDGTLDVEVSGDAVNVAARLASAAGAGEALISDEARAASGLQLDGLPRRELELKGKSQTVSARIMRAH